MWKPMIGDLNRLSELMESTDQDSSHVRAVIEEFKNLNREREEDEQTEIEEEAEGDTVEYWKKKATRLEKSLKESRESKVRLFETLKTLVTQKTCEGFSTFILKNTPVIMGHQDQDLRYLFKFNHFPTLKEEELMGKTDSEISTGNGAKEFEDFKREVLENGKASKREITFETELFGSKTILIYVETVYNKNGEKIGINYIGMDVTDQVRKRERMAKLREDIAVRKAVEAELAKTRPHIQ